MKNHNRLNFDASKHDAAIAQDELDRARTKAKGKIAKVYAMWKSKMTRLKRCKRSDLIALTRDLREDMVRALSSSGLADDEFGKFTLQLCDDKISDLLALDMADEKVSEMTAHVNHFTVYKPDRPDQQPQTPEVYEFATETQFMNLPPVARVRQECGMIGLMRQGNLIHAAYESGERLLIGAVSTRVGIEKIPTVEEFEAAIKAIKGKPRVPGGGEW